jgi:serine/threonine protein phosphatase PrpC
VQFESAKIALAGHRQENQDRVDIFSNADSALIVVVDGMGGHAEGAKASETTVSTLQQCFTQAGQPVFDPQGFLTSALSLAHERVVKLGDGIALEQRPRATCAVCLVQDQNAYWAHVGDSRVYLIRDGAVLNRSRDHSHVELLLREGLIREDEVKSHPMRNFVECCIGGDRPIPDMSIAERKKLKAGDVLLVCTDGLWSGVSDAEIATLGDESAVLRTSLKALAETAVGRNAPHSDNTGAAVLRLKAGE